LNCLGRERSFGRRSLRSDSPRMTRNCRSLRSDSLRMTREGPLRLNQKAPHSRQHLLAMTDEHPVVTAMDLYDEPVLDLITKL